MRFYGDPGVAAAIFWAYLLSGGTRGGGCDRNGRARVPAALYALQHGRATGTFILPGELAGYLIVLLPVAFAVARVARCAALRALAWSASASGCVALVLTFSRAGWMGAAAAAAFWSSARPRRAAPVAAARPAAGLLAIVLLFNAITIRAKITRASRSGRRRSRSSTVSR